MLNSHFFSLFIFTYLFNLSAFFTYLQYFNAFNFSNNLISKSVSMFYFFCIVGLPITAFFFFKIRLVVHLFNNNSVFCLILFPVIVLSLFIYFNMITRFLNKKPMHNNIDYSGNKVLEIRLGREVVFYVLINIAYNLCFFFLFF